MKELNLERIWKEKNVDTKSGIQYSREQISGLRKKRERQLTGAVKSSILTGISIKFILLVAIIIFTVIGYELTNLLFTISALFIITLGMIIYDFYLLRLVAGIDNYSDNIESRLGKLNEFLTVQLPVFQIENSLSSPVFVIMGIFYYHFFKYSRFEFRAFDDVIVFVAVILISYLGTYFVSKYSLSSFRREALELLATGEERDAIINYEERRKQSRRKKLIISLILLISGIVLFALILLA